MGYLPFVNAVPSDGGTVKRASAGTGGAGLVHTQPSVASRPSKVTLATIQGVFLTAGGGVRAGRTSSATPVIASSRAMRASPIDCRRRRGSRSRHRAVGSDLDVRGFQIALDDAAVVRVFDRLGDLFCDPQRVFDGQRSDERPAFDQFHDDGADSRLP